jgi:hypothetical protein
MCITENRRFSSQSPTLLPSYPILACIYEAIQHDLHMTAMMMDVTVICSSSHARGINCFRLWEDCIDHRCSSSTTYSFEPEAYHPSSQMSAHLDNRVRDCKLDLQSKPQTFDHPLVPQRSWTRRGTSCSVGSVSTHTHLTCIYIPANRPSISA